jgi:hypothetical protein
LAIGRGQEQADAADALRFTGALLHADDRAFL